VVAGNNQGTRIRGLFGEEMGNRVGEISMLGGYPKAICCNNFGKMVTIFLRKCISDRTPFIRVD
jgi:hypothetical protein